MAHNGFNYDFPLLLAEMAAATRDGGDEGNSWDSEVMCVDSLVAMRRIFNGEGVKGDFSAAEDQAAERQLDHDVTPAGDVSSENPLKRFPNVVTALLFLSLVL